MSIFTDDLNELVAALEAGKDVPGVALEVDRLDTLAAQWLSDASKAAMEKKAYNLLLVEDGESYQCIFLTAVAKQQNVELAVQAIAADLNALAERGLIHSCLAPISSVKLALMPLQDLSLGVFAYVLVPTLRVEEARSLTQHMTEEGQIGKTIGTLEKDLPEGEFMTTIRISHMAIMQEESPDSILNAEIKTFLNLLPKGTVVMSVTKCGALDLSLTYEVRFQNPLMKQFKEVKLIHNRHCEVVNDKLKQFNLLMGVEYVKR